MKGEGEVEEGEEGKTNILAADINGGARRRLRMRRDERRAGLWRKTRVWAG